MSTTATPVPALKRRRHAAETLREIAIRHRSTDYGNGRPDGYQPDPRNDWYWERVADDLLELIDRGKLA